jgi:Lon protease-like protein
MKKIEIQNPIPLFPLPTTVLFPKIHLPLHIFEPRYREMVRDAQSSDQLIGMVLLKEGWEEEYEKNPPVHEIGCVGRMLYVQPFEDGRFNIVLFGMSRFRLQGQFFDRSYRQGWVEPIMEDPLHGRIPPALLAELIGQVREYGRLRGWQRQIESVMDLKLDNERLVNLFSAELDFTPLEKQFLLESETVLVQTKRLLDLLGFYIQEHKATQSRINPPSDTRSAS